MGPGLPHRTSPRAKDHGMMGGGAARGRRSALRMCGVASRATTRHTIKRRSDFLRHLIACHAAKAERISFPEEFGRAIRPRHSLIVVCHDVVGIVAGAAFHGCASRFQALLGKLPCVAVHSGLRRLAESILERRGRRDNPPHSSEGRADLRSTPPLFPPLETSAAADLDEFLDRVGTRCSGRVWMCGRTVLGGGELN
jgi:hypothetical protein